MPCNILFTTSCEWFHPNIRIWNQWGFWLRTIKTLSQGSFLLLPSEISVKQGLNVIKMNALLRSYFFSQYSAFISSLKDEEKTVSISISRGSKVLWGISDVWVVWGISRHLTIWFIHSTSANSFSWSGPWRIRSPYWEEEIQLGWDSSQMQSTIHTCWECY